MIGSSAGRAGAVLAVVILGSCALSPGVAPPGSLGKAKLRSARADEMNAHWRGRSLEELVAALGQPTMSAEIPGGGNPGAFIVVYADTDHASGCIDAFAVMPGTPPIVRDYHCR